MVAEAQNGKADAEDTGAKQSPEVTVPNSRVDLDKPSERDRRSTSKGKDKKEQSEIKAAKHKETSKRSHRAK